MSKLKTKHFKLHVYIVHVQLWICATIARNDKRYIWFNFSLNVNTFANNPFQKRMSTEEHKNCFENASFEFEEQ